MEKPASTPLTEITPKQFEFMGKSARTRRALNSIMKDCERALAALAQTGENGDQ